MVRSPYTKNTSIEGVDWRPQAACGTSDPELFFPVSEKEEDKIKQAKKICGRCAVRDFCLQYALETGQNIGIWGGMTEGERNALKRRNSRYGSLLAK